MMAFLRDVFHADVIKEDRYPSGRIQHARLRIGGSVIMLNESTDDYTANQSQMHVRVDDAEDTYRRALDLGAVSIMTPNLRPHGEQMAGIKDPCGNVWWIASDPD